MDPMLKDLDNGSAKRNRRQPVFLSLPLMESNGPSQSALLGSQFNVVLDKPTYGPELLRENLNPTWGRGRGTLVIPME